ncbi:uncharacterized protein LOC114364882 isoform X1 [Ostrinia furnacalis]|uniref:uncharacterized protein LOC114364882 isoform X1 n=1 Tax=Ostrinia furnacalis TaxID=93504 RepID=UPI00103C86F1|nr:uncharacterized protein LOC114364882 isoform X1 [Ostrinia furnacalis]
MPASNIDLYRMQDARNNFDAMRPAPVCTDANHYMGQCQQNIHISTNCYYGYHDPKVSENVHVNTDCEMLEEPHGNNIASPPQTQTIQPNTRKRSADDTEMPQNKRFREEVQKEKTNAPETTEIKNSNKSIEDALESLYWNTHGGNIYQFLQCL